MSKLKRRRFSSNDDPDINMVPVMNMFLVLIPFLLMSASFLHLKAINTSIPVLGESDRSPDAQKNVKITAIAEIRKDAIVLSANSDSLDRDVISEWDRKLRKQKKDEYPFTDMAEWLQRLKETYPASDTIIIIPSKDILYETIIHMMDVARYSYNEQSLFPNVVLTGRVG